MISNMASSQTVDYTGVTYHKFFNPVMVCGGSIQNCFAALGMASLDFTYLSQSLIYFKNVCSSHCNIMSCVNK